jgi:hypothetical protein
MHLRALRVCRSTSKNLAGALMDVAPRSKLKSEQKLPERRTGIDRLR